MATTKSKAKTVTLPDWQSELSEELDRADQRRRAAWSLMLTAADGSELSREDLDFLRVVGIDDSTRRREIGRLGRVLAAYRKAGTKAQRDAAAEQLQALETDIGSRVQQMTDEIARLQAEVENANTLLGKVRAVVQRQAAAVEELQAEGMLPDYVQGQLADIRKAENDCESARVIREAEARKRMIEGVLKLSDEKQMTLHAASVKTFDGEPLIANKSSDGRMITPRVNLAVWPRYVESLRAELPVLDAAIAEANKQLDVFRREAADLRAYWLTTEVEEQLQQMEVLP